MFQVKWEQQEPLRSCPDTSSSDNAHRDQRFVAHSSSDGRTHVQRLPLRPTWANGIEAILLNEGQTDAAEEDTVIYVTSYFISHRDIPFQAEPRILRFDRDVAEWESQTSEWRPACGEINL